MRSLKSCLAADNYRPCYTRQELGIDVLSKSFRCRDVTARFSPATDSLARLADQRARRMEAMGLLPAGAAAQWEHQAADTFGSFREKSTLSAPALYDYFCSARYHALGAGALEAYRARQFQEPVAFCKPYAIDQSVQKDALLARSRAVIMVLTQPELIGLFRTDVQKSLDWDKTVYGVVTQEPGRELPTQQALEAAGITGICCITEQSVPESLAADIQAGTACLLFYGEEGFLHCRGLTVDSVVHGIPWGFHAQALTGNLGGPSRPCLVYVPRGMDLTEQVPLTRKTRLTYWHLSKLWERYGDEVYQKTVPQLYGENPRLFFNVYSRRENTWPVCLPEGLKDLQTYEAAREQALDHYLNSLPGLRYICAYYDEALKRASICWDDRRYQPGILVHGVQVAQSQRAQVLRCPGDKNPRRMLEDMDAKETALISNFLFFLTPRLGNLYNDLRADRPLEQADAAAGHLDYMLCYEGQRRIETFPLFSKACIALTREGRFLLFNFRLGGGSARVGSHCFRWEKEQVDSGQDAPVTVLTPMLSQAHLDQPKSQYTLAVGEGRVNLVILQDRICTLRRGSVLLPSVGAVISLREDAAQPLLAELRPLKDGYYDTTGLELELCLDSPEEIPSREWEQVLWAYGGGMTLMRDGVELCAEGMEEALSREGWMSPMSRQTQESELHTLVKHPRTAIGLTRGGELVILVYSGRTWRSSGADYRQMCAIARDLVPDLESLMNVDGGGSSMLGIVRDGDFMELSYPSSSKDSCVGMTRPVRTVLYIPIENGEQTLITKKTEV